MTRPIRRLALLALAVFGLLSLPSCIYHRGHFRGFPFPHFHKSSGYGHSRGHTRYRSSRANRRSSRRPRRGHRR